MNSVDRPIDWIFSKQRWFVHALFWMLVLAFYVVFFGRKNDNYAITLIFTGLLMPITIGATYFLNYFLIPRFLLTERYTYFALYFCYTLIGTLFLETVISYVVYIVFANLQIKSMSAASIDFIFLMSSLLVVVFLGGAIKMLMHWRKSKEDYQKLMHEKVETELKFLKMQLNPHFLFNTLNNLYTLATDKSDKTPHAILALSELLDYVLHNTSSTFTALENEIQQTRNYIALESLRYEERLRIDFEIRGELVGRSVPPMLLITLTDNAFKHGVMSSIQESWISLIVDCQSKPISIEMKNSLGASKKVNGFGIGLENLKNQLMLLYGDRHRFEIEKSEQLFQVNITLHEI